MPDEPGQKSSKISMLWTPELVAPALAAAVPVVSTLIATRAPATENLTVVTARIPAADHSEYRGRVLRDGDAVDKASVWLIQTDAQGNTDSPPATQSDEKGGFNISSVPNKLGIVDIAKATIYAKKEIPSWYAF